MYYRTRGEMKMKKFKKVIAAVLVATAIFSFGFQTGNSDVVNKNADGTFETNAIKDPGGGGGI